MNLEVTLTTSQSEADLEAALDRERLPRHLAVIMDGNGRWARERGLPRAEGHRRGASAAHLVVEDCDSLGIAEVSLYTFSAENWRRPNDEVRTLMFLIEHYLRQELVELHQKGVRVQWIGREDGLPSSLRNQLREAQERTRDNSGLVLNLAINYGGRTEIVDAAASLVREALEGKITPEQVDEQQIARHLYRPDMPDPDLLIRTAGELRVSNFLLWQLAYTEIWVTQVLWPDFRRLHLLQALVDYQRRQRKFGGAPETSEE